MKNQGVVTGKAVALKRFSVPIYVEVEAVDADEAFAKVRTDYVVINDHNTTLSGYTFEQMHIEEPTELDEDESLFD